MDWSPNRPLQVAIIGSGPSGFYAAEALLKQKDVPVRVDIFDRLPTPYGLVRGGVAPDHQKIKSVIVVYEKVALLPACRFFGNIRLGRDLSIQELRGLYDQIVFAIGNESDRHLGIPGEDLAGSYSATAFVGWYNGHPDYRDLAFDLSVERAAVIGIGNVAMDVTRILAQDPEELAKTDITDYALEALRHSKIKEIYLLGRRGPAQAAYSPAEIQEIGGLKSSDLVVDLTEVVLDDASKAQLKDPETKRNVDYVTEVSRQSSGSKPKKVRLRFCVSPVDILGENGRVAALKIERNNLIPDDKGDVKARGTGQFETLPVGMVLRSVGYRGIPIPGVPFDERSGHIPNNGGRVLDKSGHDLIANQYVVGWAKRGPTGLIGTNRADSVATVQAMLEDAKKNPARTDVVRDLESLPRLLTGKKIRFVTFQGWKKLDQFEIERGAKAGKIREKFTRTSEMLAILET